MFIKKLVKHRVFRPVSPIVPGLHIAEIQFAKNQPQYLVMPAARSKSGIVTSRWKMCWRDRLLTALQGYVYVQVLTSGSPQPIKVMAVKPNIETLV